MLRISRSQAANALRMEFLHRQQQLRQKIELFEKMYGDFSAFEMQVKGEAEDFKRWDDYMEYKACREELAEVIHDNEELQHDHFEIA